VKVDDCFCLRCCMKRSFKLAVSSFEFFYHPLAMLAVPGLACDIRVPACDIRSTRAQTTCDNFF
jgi:hypothetical protein